MGNEQQQCQSVAKLVASRFQLSHVFYFLFFVIGLSFGLSVSSYVNSFSFSLHASVFSVPLSPASSLPLPAEPTPPVHNSSSFASNIRLPLHMHNMDDDQLFSRALMVSRVQNDEHVSKIAFMFLAKGSLHLSPLWEKFFKGHQGLYTIYIHHHPSYNGSVPEGSVFQGRRIPSKVSVLHTLAD